MSGAVRSIISHGSEGTPVDIECHLSNSLPNIVIVGAGNRTVDEAKERIRGAFSSSGLAIPRRRISINLAPADVPKDSSSLDLPIAIAIVAGSQTLVRPPAADEAYIGELGLDGTIRPVRGIIGKLLSGRKLGFKKFFIPAGNIRQASIIPGITLIAVNSLHDMAMHLTGEQPLSPIKTGKGEVIPADDSVHPLTIDDVVGQTQAKRAIEIAAAGGHNVLLSGPPGTGKSMLAKAMASLLPAMNREEILEATHLHSLSGHSYDRLVTARPVRSPHHSASHVAIVGGGNVVRPGEVSLAHRGILFFDELPEFARATIEALRQPLEDKTITVSRAKESVQYPANFIFVATANPCPCGYYGSNRPCGCSAQAIRLYRRKLSGPLLDRIDICVDVEQVDYQRLLLGDTEQATPASQPQTGPAASTPSDRINRARHRQAARFGTASKLNSDMSNRDLRQLANVTQEAKQLLDVAARNLQLSARAYLRTLRVARTIADLDTAERIEPIHITEALQYRARSNQP